VLYDCVVCLTSVCSINITYCSWPDSSGNRFSYMTTNEQHSADFGTLTWSDANTGLHLHMSGTSLEVDFSDITQQLIHHLQGAQLTTSGLITRHS